jgi:hypothetical protein
MALSSVRSDGNSDGNTITTEQWLCCTDLRRTTSHITAVFFSNDRIHICGPVPVRLGIQLIPDSVARESGMPPLNDETNNRHCDYCILQYYDTSIDRIEQSFLETMSGSTAKNDYSTTSKRVKKEEEADDEETDPEEMNDEAVESSPLDSRKRSHHSSETATTSAKRRPYRRTKRPAGYNDKSSITTTTNVLWQQPLNVFDSILAESQDLLQAATEAQQLGRYKIAATYLILLHTRLVGLGKRFDKIKMTGGPTRPSLPSQSQPSSSHWEVDTALMEHLARAAAELHAARKWDISPGGDAAAPAATELRSPLQSPDARTFLAHTANQQGVTNAATVTGVAQSTGAAVGWTLTVDASTGRKPVTTAMNTVPYANCNARALLRGGPMTAAVAVSQNRNKEEKEELAAV